MKTDYTERINHVIKRHFNRYFKQQYITENMNEWSALRRSIKKLLSDFTNTIVEDKDKEIEEYKIVLAKLKKFVSEHEYYTITKQLLKSKSEDSL